MRTTRKRVLSFILTLCLLASVCSLSAGALTFRVGDRLGNGTITSVYNRTLASGVTYSRAIYKDSNQQFVYALACNPRQSDYMPLVYSKYAGYGDTTLNSAKAAEAKGYDVLLLTEDVDEFCLQILRTYPRKDAEGKDGTVEFKNVNSGDLGLETEDEKKAAEDATAENKPLFDAMKDALDGKVKEVKVSTRLKDHPVCLSADGPLSIEMEKVLSKQPGSEGVKSDKVLELNIHHPVFAVLKAAQEAGDTEKLKKYSDLLYAQAQLIEGLPVDDPAAYAEAVCSLMK
mgnify:CR=1 FL=1